jgi:hypothetical protein
MTIFTRPRWCIEPLRPQPKAVTAPGLPLGAETGSQVEGAAWATMQQRRRAVSADIHARVDGYCANAGARASRSPRAHVPIWSPASGRTARRSCVSIKSGRLDRGCSDEVLHPLRVLTDHPGRKQPIDPLLNLADGGAAPRTSSRQG